MNTKYRKNSKKERSIDYYLGGGAGRYMGSVAKLFLAILWFSSWFGYFDAFIQEEAYILNANFHEHISLFFIHYDLGC
ncbi:hypothetical protein, partial [Companilactobacillus furfuricola]|uniref:hypothetical protein n=1 Tax=Companilactobacillus furfuricola TaxID=1462575 RepID=UPI001B885B1B